MISDDISSIQSGDSCSYDESDSTHDLRSNGGDVCPRIKTGKTRASDSSMDVNCLTPGAPAAHKSADRKNEITRRLNIEADQQAGQFLKSMSKAQRDEWLDKQGYSMTRDRLLAPDKSSKQVWDTVGGKKNSSKNYKEGWNTADRIRSSRDDSYSDGAELDYVNQNIKNDESNSNDGDAGYNHFAMGDHDANDVKCSDDEDFIRKFEQSKLIQNDQCRQKPTENDLSGSFISSDLSESEIETGMRKFGKPDRTTKICTEKLGGNVYIDSKCESAMADKIKAPLVEFVRADTNTPNTIINKRYAKLMSKMAGDGFSGLGDMEICTRHSQCESGDHVTKPTIYDVAITSQNQRFNCGLREWKMDRPNSQMCDEEISENRINEFYTNKGVYNSEKSLSEKTMSESNVHFQKTIKDGRDCDKQRPSSNPASSSRIQGHDSQNPTSTCGETGKGLRTSEMTDTATEFEARVSDNLNQAHKAVAEVAIENVLGVARRPENLDTDLATISRLKKLDGQTYSTIQPSLSQTDAFKEKPATLNSDFAKGSRVKTADIQTDSSTGPSITPTDASQGDQVNTGDNLQRPQGLEYGLCKDSPVYESLTASPDMEATTAVGCEYHPVTEISKWDKSGEENITKMNVSHREPPTAAIGEDNNVADNDACSIPTTRGIRAHHSYSSPKSCDPMKTLRHQSVDKSGLRVRFNIQEIADGDNVILLETAGGDEDNCSVGGIFSQQVDGVSFNKIQESTNLPPVLRKDSFDQPLAQSCTPADCVEYSATYMRAKSLNETSNAGGKSLADPGGITALRKEISKQLVSRALKNTRGNRTILEMKKQERANYQKFEALKQNRLDEEKKQQLALMESNKQGPEYCITGNKVNVEKKSKLYKPNIPHLTNPNYMPLLGGAKLVTPVTRTVKVKLPSINQAACVNEKTGRKNKEDVSDAKKLYPGISVQNRLPEKSEREGNKNTNKATSHDSNVSTPACDRINDKQKVEVMTFEKQHGLTDTAKSMGTFRDKNSGTGLESKKTRGLVLPKISQSQNQKIHSTNSLENHSSEDMMWSKKEQPKSSGVDKIVSAAAKTKKMDSPQATSQQNKGDHSRTKTDLTAKSCLPPIFEKKTMKDIKASVEYSHRNILENSLSENSPLSSPTAPCKLPKVGVRRHPANNNESVECGRVKGREKVSRLNLIQGTGRSKQNVAQTKEKGNKSNVNKPLEKGAKKKCKSREDKGNEAPQQDTREAASVGTPVQNQFEQVQAEIDQQVVYVLSSMKNQEKQQAGAKPLSSTQQLLIKAKTDFLDQLEEMDASFLDDIVSDASTAMYARDKKRPLIRKSEPSSLDELKKRHSDGESRHSSSASTSKSDSEDDESEEEAENDDYVEEDGGDTTVDGVGGKHVTSSIDEPYVILKAKALSKARSSVKKANDKIISSSADDPHDYPKLNKSSNAVVSEIILGGGMHQTNSFVKSSENGRSSPRQTDVEISQRLKEERIIIMDQHGRYGNSLVDKQEDADCWFYEEDVFLLDKMSFSHNTHGVFVLNEDFAVSIEQLLYTGACGSGHQIPDDGSTGHRLTKDECTPPDSRFKTTKLVHASGNDAYLTSFSPYTTEKKSRKKSHINCYTAHINLSVNNDAGLTECCYECYNSLNTTNGTGSYFKMKGKEHFSATMDFIFNHNGPRLYLQNHSPLCLESPTNCMPLLPGDCGPFRDDVHPLPIFGLQGLSDSGFWETDQEQNTNFNNSKGDSEAEEDHAHSQCPSVDDYSTRCDLERMHCWSTSMDTLLPCKDDATAEDGNDLPPKHKQIRRSRIPVRFHNVQPRHWSGQVLSFQCNNVPQNLVVILKNKNGVKIGQAVVPILFTEMNNRATSTNAQLANMCQGNSANYFTVEIRGPAVQIAESGQESAEDETKPVSLAERIKKYQKNLPRNIHCGRGTKLGQLPEQPSRAPPGEIHAQNQVRNSSGESSGRKMLSKRQTMEFTSQLDLHTNRNESTLEIDQTKGIGACTNHKSAEGTDGALLKEEPNLTPCIKSAKIHKNIAQSCVSNRHTASKTQTTPKKLSAGDARVHQQQVGPTPHEQHDSPLSPNSQLNKTTCLISQCELFTPISSPQSLNVHCVTTDKRELCTASSTVVNTGDQIGEPKCDILCEGHPSNCVTDTTLQIVNDNIFGQHMHEDTDQYIQTRRMDHLASSPILDPAKGLANQFVLEHPSVLAVDVSLNLFLEYEKATSHTRDNSPVLEQQSCNNSRDYVTESHMNQPLEITRERGGKDTERSDHCEKLDEIPARCSELQTEDHICARRLVARTSSAKRSEDDHQHNGISRESTPHTPELPDKNTPNSPDKYFLQLIHRKVEHLQNFSLLEAGELDQNESEYEQEEHEREQGEHEQEHDLEVEHNLREEQGDIELNDLDLIEQQTGESQRSNYSTVEQTNPSVTSFATDVADNRRNQNYDSHDFEPKITESYHSLQDLRYEQSPSHGSKTGRNSGTHDLDVPIQSFQISTPYSVGNELNEVKDQCPCNGFSTTHLNTPPATGDSYRSRTQINQRDVGESGNRRSLTCKTSSPVENGTIVQTTDVQNETRESNETKRVNTETVMKKSGIDLNPKAAAMSPTISKKSLKSRGVLFEKINFNSAESESSEVRLKESNNHNSSRIPFLQKSYSLGKTRLQGGKAKASLSSDDDQEISNSHNGGQMLPNEGDSIPRNTDIKMGDTILGNGKGWNLNENKSQRSQTDTKKSLVESKKSQIPVKSSKTSSGKESPVAAHQEHCVVPYTKTLGDDLLVKDCVLEYSMGSISQSSQAQPRKGRLTMIFPTLDSAADGDHLESVQTSHFVMDNTYSNDEEFYSSEENDQNTTFSVDEYSKPAYSLDPLIATNSQEWTTTDSADQKLTAYSMEQTARTHSVEEHGLLKSTIPLTPINTLRKTTPKRTLKKAYKQVVKSQQNSIPLDTPFQQNALPPLSTRQAGFPHRPKLKRYY